jgi:ABC-2 type transport system permease protein
MRRIRLIARREFVASISRKGFLIGLLLMPLLMIVLVTFLPRFLLSRSPQVQGQVLLVDDSDNGSGSVASELRATLDPEAINQRRVEGRRRGANQAPGQGAAGFNAGPPGAAPSPVPHLQLVTQPGASLQQLKTQLGQQAALALVVIAPDALTRREGAPDFGSYDIYISSRLDENTENTLHESLRIALVGARLKAGGLDPVAVATAMRVVRPEAVIVATGGEQQSRRGFNRILPFAMGILLFIGVMTGGQTLMTSTIEEKSSRVVEVLLAAASPLELMWGKLLGQLGIGLVILAVYVGLGLLSLFQFAMLGLLDPMMIVYLFVFFLLSYLIYGTLMLTIGAAVNQVADAQALMGPVMLLLIAPYVMAPMIGQAPNSAVSIALSFLPPLNTFAMLARLASASPPPLWQVLLTIVVGIGAACLTVWFAAKVFRVALLMQGKPPSFRTLWKWARMA